ncbi:MAG: biotin carboxylase [Actinobacteria bacterium]|nr:biotin carboxylase [Actinomycetota bacterium]
MASSIEAPMQGTVLSVVPVGSLVRAGGAVVILESMKMQHDVIVDHPSRVVEVKVAAGDTVMAGSPLVVVESADVATADTPDGDVAGGPRVDLTEVIDRHRSGLDAARPEATGRRHEAGRRTARENVADLVDVDSFVEYGPLVIAAQRRRRGVDDLIARTPADGLVGGIGRVNGELFAGRESRVVVMSYDYTVLAGTQGQQNHRKKDRLFDVAERLQVPVVFFAEGGGGRPGDTDGLGVSGLDCWAFHDFARLSGLVPLVGITGGYCFAGNAAILGCCDVVIALEGSNIGMGGPAMIEGGGLGVFEPTAIGPLSVQRVNGVVDLVAQDDAHAVVLAKKYLSYFQGPVGSSVTPDQTGLRDVVPTNRKKAYDMHDVLDGLFDIDSVLELRRDFGIGMITALARVDGRPVGVVANNPVHLAGAIDSDGADKAARFMQLCDAFDLPIVTLVDTPGMMVGPDVEETALVRHCSRLFVTAVNITVPVVSVVVRKSYGLGAQAIMAGSTKAPLACVAWPTGEFGGMGLEGAVRLGYRNELVAITDPIEREATFQQMVDRMYEHGKALSVSTHFEIDDVIDPADTRRWINAVFESAPLATRQGKKRPNVDTW